jgi:hypothetical protein
MKAAGLDANFSKSTAPHPTNANKACADSKSTKQGKVHTNVTGVQSKKRGRTRSPLHLCKCFRNGRADAPTDDGPSGFETSRTTLEPTGPFINSWISAVRIPYVVSPASARRRGTILLTLQQMQAQLHAFMPEKRSTPIMYATDTLQVHILRSIRNAAAHLYARKWSTPNRHTIDGQNPMAPAYARFLCWRTGRNTVDHHSVVVRPANHHADASSLSRRLLP